MDGTSSAKLRLVVVGNGMAGARLVEEVHRRAPGRYAVTVLGAEPTPAYNRIMLSAVLAGDKTVPDIVLGSDAAPAPDTNIVTGDAAVAIDRDAHRVRTASGRSFAYDVLVLATGSNPIMLPLPGVDLPGVATFRDLQDVAVMIAAASRRGRAVVIGGGLLGLEAAEGLRRRGMAVTVVHLMPFLMERQLDASASALLQRSLETRGLSFVLSAETEAILGQGRVEGVRLADGRILPADLVVMAVGIKPNAELARTAGLACGRGVIVDDAMCSSDAAIYAVGECVEHRGRSYGLVAPLWEQVEVCARRLAGNALAAYAGSMTATSLKVTGVDLYSVGELSADGGNGEEIVLSDPGRGVYRKLVLRDGRLTGAVLYGDAADGAWYAELVREGRTLNGVRGELVFGRAFIGEPAVAGVT
jgi:nitrite reductase (NADH) large subunit